MSLAHVDEEELDLGDRELAGERAQAADGGRGLRAGGGAEGEDDVAGVLEIGELHDLAGERAQLEAGRFIAGLGSAAPAVGRTALQHLAAKAVVVVAGESEHKCLRRGRQTPHKMITVCAQRLRMNGLLMR